MKLTLKKRIVQGKDFSHKKTLGVSNIVIPLSGTIKSLATPILNQGYVEDCTAYTAVEVRRSLTEKTYDPTAFWNGEIAVSGDPNALENGVDLQTQGATGRLVGWSSDGVIEKSSSYVFVNAGIFDPFDQFDLIRSTFMAQGAMSGGLTWDNSWTNAPGGIIPHTTSSPLGGHDISIVGLTFINGIDYLILQNHWGTSVGDQGLFYLDRYMANRVFSGYGVLYWSNNATYAQTGLLEALLTNLLNLYKYLFAPKQGFPPPPPVTPITSPSLLPNLVQGIFAAEGNDENPQLGRKYNNWGDIRGKIGNKYVSSLGATGYGEDNLAIFPTKEIGDAACLQLVTDVANNLMMAYPKPCSIKEFAMVYADPTTTLEWENYTKILCEQVGLPETTTLTTLLKGRD